MVPGWVYKKFQLEKNAEDDPLAVTQANSRLFLLVDEMRERQRRLSMILTRGLGGAANGAPLLFGGLYLAATGNTDATQQAFVAGVFSRLDRGAVVRLLDRRDPDRGGDLPALDHVRLGGRRLPGAAGGRAGGLLGVRGKG